MNAFHTYTRVSQKVTPAFDTLTVLVQNTSYFGHFFTITLHTISYLHWCTSLKLLTLKWKYMCFEIFNCSVHSSSIYIYKHIYTYALLVWSIFAVGLCAAETESLRIILYQTAQLVAVCWEHMLEDKQQSDDTGLCPCYGVVVSGVTGCSALSFNLNYWGQIIFQPKESFQIPQHVPACGPDFNQRQPVEVNVS